MDNIFSFVLKTLRKCLLAMGKQQSGGRSICSKIASCSSRLHWVLMSLCKAQGKVEYLSSWW